jgi:D-alanine-D-alanine ligase-like ATP-grasp enzyme
MTNTQTHVAVLMGGWSSEREVSLRSGEACAKALEAQGYRATRLDVGRDVAIKLAELGPDVCFNALHGRFGEDGCIQGVLETLGIPYTHSGVLASALAMHKEQAKTVMRAAGIPVMGEEALGVIEIRPAEGLTFYDYTSKYAPGGSIHVLPAPLLPNVYQLVQKLSLAAHRALGCRGVSRSDFRFDDRGGGEGEMICLEVNTQPGMTSTSLVPELAAYSGRSFGELVRWILEDASCNR